MKPWRWFRKLLFSLGVPLGLFGACDTGGLVGGKCREGALFCGDCVDPSTDVSHCGSCDHACDAGVLCMEGRCENETGGASGGLGGATSGEGGGSGAAEAGAAQGGDASRGGTAGATNGRGGAGGSGGSRPSPQAGAAGFSCDPPLDTSAQCGDCETQCVDPSPLCAPTETGGYQCVPSCPIGLLACGDQCVDVNVNPLHCGECFNLCPSGICQAGMCVGASPGHVALYCMNYTWAQPETAHSALLGNAVFLPARARVRVLAFTRWASAFGLSQVEKVVRWSGEARGRSAQVDAMQDPAQLSAQLSVQNYDVFLIHEQTNATAEQLVSMGAAWSSTGVVNSFAQAGGVVIVLGGGSANGNMAALIDSLGLLSVQGQNPIALEDTTTRFYNRAPGDALGINVVSPLSPVPESCTFETTAEPSADTVFVVTDAPSPETGKPVVVHRIIAP